MRFYLYDDPAITLNDWLSHIPASLKHDTSGVVYDLLKTHPLRTADFSKADLFVVAIPLRRSYHLDRENHRDNVDLAFSALFKTPTFQRFQGNDHLFLAHFWEFSAWSSVLPKLIPSEYLERLENVTCTRYEYYGVSKWENVSNILPQDCPEPRSLFTKPWEPTRYTVLTPHASAPELKVYEPNFDEWSGRPYWIFYHTRREPFHCGATELRHLAIEKRELFEGSIGYGLPREQWVQSWGQSKFALIVRGDTPGTTSFVNAISAGCIPVIISDAFEMVVLPFKSHLSLEEFSIILPETHFLNRPESVMPYLKSLQRSVVEEKLTRLREVQRFLLYRHPKSRTIQTILSEFAAIKRFPVPCINSKLTQVESMDLDEVHRFILGQIFLYGRGKFVVVSRAEGTLNSLNVLKQHFGWTGSVHHDLSSDETWNSEEDSLLKIDYAYIDDKSLNDMGIIFGLEHLPSAVCLNKPESSLRLGLQALSLARKGFTLVWTGSSRTCYLNYGHQRTLRLQRDMLLRGLRLYLPDRAWVLLERTNFSKHLETGQKTLRFLRRDRSRLWWAIKKRARTFKKKLFR